MKEKYMKPSMMVVKIHHSGIVCTSDPQRDVPLWSGEAGARRRGNDVWDDEYGWEDE